MSDTISKGLKIHIHLNAIPKTLRGEGSPDPLRPQVVPFAIDLNGPAHRARGNGEDFVTKEGASVSLVLPLQSSSINGYEFDAPEVYRFAAHVDAWLSKQIFDITMAEIEKIVEPDGVTDDIG